MRKESQRKILVKPILTSENATSETLSTTAKRIPIYGFKEGDTIEGRNRRETFCFLINRYGEETTIHGLDRICQRKTGFKERIIWTIGFLVALYIFTAMYAILSERYRRRQFQTTVNETYFPIFKVPFPELVICNKNRLNWARLNEAMDLYLAPAHHTPQLRELFTDIVSRYDHLTLNSMHKFQDLGEKPLNILNYINFTNVVDLMSWRCDEILADCKWEWQVFNCCEIFFTRRTILGQCLSFNSIISKGGLQKMKTDTFWPWHYGHYGRGSGLQLRVLIKEKLHSPYTKYNPGIYFMTVDHGAYSDFLFTTVHANSVAYVAIWGSYSFPDKFLRSVSSNVRECVFKDEINSNDYKSLQGLSYEYENCFFACQQLNMIEACNCTFDLFFPPGPYPICQLVDAPCLAKNWNDFKYLEANAEAKSFVEINNTEPMCQCFFNCHSLLLQNYVNIEQLRPKQLLEVNDSFVDLDFYWRHNYIITYKTSLVFNWLDLLVSFGGIASLLLGCSLISIVELIIFLLLKTPYFIWKKHRSEKRLKQLQTNRSIKNLMDYDSKH